MNFDFAQTANGMVTASFRGNQLHVFEKDGNYRQARLLCDVIYAWLARANANTIATGPLREHDQVKFTRGPAKVLEFTNAARIQFATFKQETNSAAEDSLEPGCVPDRFIAKNQDRKTARAPAKSA